MSSFQRVIAIVLLAGQLSACTSWRPEGLLPAEVIRTARPTALRVERQDGHREVFYHPHVQGDSLLGRAYNMSNRALALMDVKQVATRHVSASRTAGLVLGMGLLVAIVAGESCCYWVDTNP
ncbi:MAG TPA: hypothetical protein VH439_01495 [Gemmatimonadales bacterium]